MGAGQRPGLGGSLLAAPLLPAQGGLDPARGRDAIEVVAGGTSRPQRPARTRFHGRPADDASTDTGFRRTAAVAVALRGAAMFEKVGVPILGVAENMSFLEGADGSRQYLFGQGGGLKVATALQTVLLGEVPLDQTIRQGGDHGIPVVISHPDSNPARVFRSVGLTVLQGLEKQA